jgi:hypothetical protein
MTQNTREGVRRWVTIVGVAGAAGVGGTVTIRGEVSRQDLQRLEDKLDAALPILVEVRHLDARLGFAERELAERTKRVAELAALTQRVGNVEANQSRVLAKLDRLDELMRSRTP